MTQTTTGAMYLRHRPATFPEVLGNDAAVAMLQSKLAEPEATRPHCYLLTGLSGGGKTTLARIMAKALGALPTDIHERNCSDDTGIDAMRAMVEGFQYLPDGPCSVYILDEVHALSKPAWSMLLKPLEDSPRHIYIFLLTSESHKVPDANRNRCLAVEVKPLGPRDGKKLLKRTCAAEAIDLPTEAAEAILDASEGSARQILSNLEKVSGALAAGSELDAALGLLTCAAEDDEDAKSLYNALVRGDWVPVVKGLKGKKEAEGVRRAVLAYCNAIFLSSGGKHRDALNIMQVFASANLFDSGDAGLTVLCSGVDAMRGA